MDYSKLLKKRIFKTPNTPPFSRMKYITSYAREEDQFEFLRELYITSVEARYHADWQRVEKLFDRWEQRLQENMLQILSRHTAMEGQAQTPWVDFNIPLSVAKIAVVTTGGFYLKSQEPYKIDDPAGDWTFREFPKDVPREDIRVIHPGYDLEGPRQDVNCVFPLDRFQELEQEGVIGQMADTNYSFMGYIRKNSDRLVNESVPEVASRMKAAGVDAAFLTST